MSIFKTVLGKILNLSSDELQELTQNPETSETLSDDEISQALEQKYKEKVARIEKVTAAKAVKNNTSKFIREISDAFDVSGAKSTEKLIEQLASLTSKTDDSQSENNIDPAKAFALPEVQAKIKELKDSFSQAQQLLEQEKQGRKTDIIRSKLNSFAMDLMKSKNALLSEDADVRKRQQRAFLSQLNPEDFELDSNEDLVLKEPIDSKTFEPVSPSDYVMKRNIFQFKEEAKRKDKPELPDPKGGSTEFTKEDLSGQGYQNKMRELRKAGDLEAVEKLRNAYYEKTGIKTT